MKKIAILATIILTVVSITKSYGQDTLKASNRNFLTELNVNLFQGQISLNSAINQIKLRYMTSDYSAYRMGITIDSKRFADNDESVYGTNPTKDKETKTSTLLAVSFGKEKHFAGSKRLSPYIGFELTLGYKWSKHEIETTSGTTTYDGAWRESQYVQYNNGYNTGYYSISSFAERGYFSYGLNIVTGFDFYVAKHLFIGYEIEFGYNHKDYTKIDITSTSGSTSDPTDYSSKESSFGARVINGIRIGYVF
jgi:hypothetical protein